MLLILRSSQTIFGCLTHNYFEDFLCWTISRAPNFDQETHTLKPSHLLHMGDHFSNFLN